MITHIVRATFDGDNNGAAGRGTGSGVGQLYGRNALVSSAQLAEYYFHHESEHGDGTEGGYRLSPTAFKLRMAAAASFSE